MSRPYSNMCELINAEYDPAKATLDNADDVRNGILYLIWNELFTISEELRMSRDKLP